MVESLHVPFERSYWVTHGRLLAGCYPGDLDPDLATEKLRGLVNAGIQHVITLMEEGESSRFTPYMTELTELAAAQGIEVSSVRLPIRDVNIPSREAMVGILDEIDRSLQKEQPVYIHCVGNQQKWDTFAGCQQSVMPSGGHRRGVDVLADDGPPNRHREREACP